VRAQLEAAQSSLSEAKAARAEAAAALAAKDAAIESLTTLSLRGDATVQEFKGSVKVGGGHGLECRGRRTVKAPLFMLRRFRRPERPRWGPGRWDRPRGCVCGVSVRRASLSFVWGDASPPRPARPRPPQALASDLRAAQLRLADVEGQLQQKEEERQAAAAEVRRSPAPMALSDAPPPRFCAEQRCFACPCAARCMLAARSSTGADVTCLLS
jgi:hypothetical protein